MKIFTTKSKRTFGLAAEQTGNPAQAERIRSIKTGFIEKMALELDTVIEKLKP